HTIDGATVAALQNSLPFALTAGQRRAVNAILADMALATPMRRLVQGDVGCGKTAVAMHAVAAAADGGYQTAVMAPTEVLAEQHGRTFRRWLEPLGLQVAVLTGSSENARELRARVASGDVHLLVGTQALIQKATQFQNLGLVIVDEQHRFGVRQRVTLANKGRFPDLLHLTATPIPRSLALAIEGAVDLTVIDELPPGRRPVKTSYVPEEKLAELYAFIEAEARSGRQTYYVCPLIEESEELSARAVTERFQTLGQTTFGKLRAGLLHGRLNSDEKDGVLRAFEHGELDVLFTTTVIEVGVDVPRATVMVIEDAARFGLAQLHQLRGRVGRGRDAGWCFLLGKPTTESGRRRLETLCATNSGFDIAEADLQLRGPGELLGLRQAGIGELRLADLRRDAALLLRARQDADALLELN
ncbi:MAG: ATP-dependent DNA helicase RecG, partial [Candidatus Hydrogenedentales bacterium]